MESLLQQLVVGQIYAFMLVFTRVGTAMMIMPGIGDGFVPPRVRLLFALAFSAVLTPVLMPALPEFNEAGPAFMLLMCGEFLMGAFIGGIARIFMTGLDTAGMLISMHMGLANAQIFNPAFATQGSIMGAFLSVTGALILFATNLHHLLLGALMDSYRSFPPGQLNMHIVGDMASAISTAVSQAFTIGFHFAMPFMLVTMMIYIAMGVLARVMPQLQVFILSMPIQITVGLMLFALVLSAGMLYWMTQYESAIRVFLMPSKGIGG